MQIDRTGQLAMDHSGVVQTTQQLWPFTVRHVHRGDKGSAAALL